MGIPIKPPKGWLNETYWFTTSCNVRIMYFYSCIQMNINAGYHGKKGVSFLSVNSHVMQMIMIENSIVNTFWTCPVVIRFFIFFRSSWYRRIQTDIPVRFSIYATPVGWRGAVIFAGTAALFTTGKRTTPLNTAASGTVTPINNINELKLLLNTSFGEE